MVSELAEIGFHDTAVVRGVVEAAGGDLKLAVKQLVSKERGGAP